MLQVRPAEGIKGAFCILSSSWHMFSLDLRPFLSEIEIRVPEPDHSDLPTLWWDLEADKCLLLGVYKHGERVGNTSLSSAYLKGLHFLVRRGC